MRRPDRGGRASGKPSPSARLKWATSRRRPDATYEGDLFEIEKRIIQRVVEGQIAAEPTIIVGRGAAQTLRGRACVLSVFVHAPEAWRVDRAKQVYSLPDTNAAQKMVRESDRSRRDSSKPSPVSTGRMPTPTT